MNYLAYHFLCFAIVLLDDEQAFSLGKMNLTKDQKKQKSQDLAAEITKGGSLFFTAYQGLKFTDMAELRVALAPTGTCSGPL